MKVFLAAPLFNDADRAHNSKIAGLLRANDFETWLAQESGLIKKGSRTEKRRIFKTDLSALEGCDVILARLDGADVDSGVAFELGYAAAKGKPIIGLKTDLRSFSTLEEVNLIVEMSLKELCKDTESAVRALRRIKAAQDS